jgi:RNA polymerase sigma-70 factor (ECF subfamily)
MSTCFAVRDSYKTIGDESRSDLELAAGIARRDPVVVRLVMQRNNQRLFRAAWQILRNREDAEDAVQSGYLKAFAAIKSFAGRSSLSTWLTRIVINNALAHARAARRRRSLLEESKVPILDDYREMLMRGSIAVSPECVAAGKQIRHIVDDAIGLLPAPFRAVFVLRQIEDLDVAQVAETLGIPAATVKTRHLRARRRLQRLLGPGLCAASGEISFDRDSGERPAIPTIAPPVDFGPRQAAE